MTPDIVFYHCRECGQLNPRITCVSCAFPQSDTERRLAEAKADAQTRFDHLCRVAQPVVNQNLWTAQMKLAALRYAEAQSVVDYLTEELHRELEGEDQ